MTALPGLTPRLPVTIVGVLVFVTVEPPSTANELSGWATAVKGSCSSARIPKTKAVNVAASRTPTYEEIARLAEQYWADRGWQDGYAEQDWLRAEQELLGVAS